MADQHNLTRGLAALALLALSGASAADCPAFLDHELKRLRSPDMTNICDAYAGKPLLVVNTASHCGFTPQFEGLEALHQRYRKQGLVVLGFPSNDFKQEAASETETAQVCFLNYGVTFPMFAPVSVRGDTAHPLFQELARQTQAPGWNFNKYLIDRDGKIVRHFGSTTAPDAPALIEAIESVL